MVGQANEMTLVLDGKSLYYTVLPDLRKDFIDLCTSCKAVVCCRVSPIQKAEMVELVNNNIFLMKSETLLFSPLCDSFILPPTKPFISPEPLKKTTLPTLFKDKYFNSDRYIPYKIKYPCE